MLLNDWKVIVISWADALGAVETPVNFITDVSVDIFRKICSCIEPSAQIDGIEDAIKFIQGFYPALVLGEDTDDRLLLLGTCYLILVSIHRSVEELCTKLFSLPEPVQYTIKTMLESFIDVPPTKLTKELVYSILAKLPDNCDSAPNTPHTLVFSNTPPSGGRRLSTPGSNGRRKSTSQTLKRIRLRLKHEQSVNEALQEELDLTKESISNMESVIKEKNAEISRLKTCYHNATDGLAQTPANTPSVSRECAKCKSLEKKMSTCEDDSLQKQSEIVFLTKSAEALKKKIANMDVEKRLLEKQLQGHVEQIGNLDDKLKVERSQKLDLMSLNEELEAIIQEMKESNKMNAAKVLGDVDAPQSLANEIIDIQKVELRIELEEKEKELQELINAHHNEKSRIEEINRDLNDRVNHLTEGIELLRTEKTSIEVELRKRNGQLEKCRDEVDYLAFQISVLEESSLRKEKEHEQTQLNLNKKVEELTCECETSSAEKEVINCKYHDLEKEMLLAIEELSVYKAKVSQLSSQVSALNDELSLTNERYEVDVKRSQNRIEECEMIISSTTVEIQLLETNLEQAKRLHAKLSSVLADRENTVAELKLIEDQLSNQLETEKCNSESFEKEIVILREESKLREKCIGDLNEEIGRMNMIISALKEEATVNNSTISELKMVLDTAVSQNELSSEKIVELEKATASASEQLEESQRQIDSLQRELNLLNECLTKSKEEHKSTVEDLSLEISNRDVIISSQLSEIKTMQAKIVEAKTIADLCEELKSRLSIKESELLQAETNADKLKTTFDEEVANHECLVAELREEIESAIVEKEVATQKLTDIEMENSLTEEKLLKSELEINELQQYLESLKNDQMQLKNERNTISKLLADERENNDTIMSKMNGMEATIQEMAGFKDVCKNLETKLTTKNGELCAAENEISHLKTTMEEEIARSMVTIDTLRNKVNFLTAENESASSNIAELEEIKLSLEEQLSSDKDKMVSLQQVLGVLNENLTILKNERDNLEKMLAEEQENHKAVIAEQVLNINVMESKLKDMSQFKDICEELTTKLATKSSELSAAEDEISRLHTAVEEERTRNKSTINSLQDRMDSVTAQIELANTEIVEQKQVRESLEEQLRTSKDRVHRVEQEFGILNEKFMVLKNERDNLSTVLAEERGNHDTVTAGYQSKIETLESTLKEISPFKEICEELKKTLMITTSELHAAQNEVSKLTTTLEEDNSRNTATINTLQDNMKSVTAHNDLAYAKIVEHEQIRDSLEEQLCASNGRVIRLEHELGTLTEKLIVLKNEQDDLSKVLTEERRSHDTIIAEHISKLNNIESTVKEMAPFKDICEELQTKLMVTTNELSASQNDLIKLKSFLEEENTRNMSTIATLRNTVNSVTAQNELAASKISELEKIRATFEEQLCTNKERTVRLDQDLQILNENLSLLKNERDNLSKVLAEERENHDALTMEQLLKIDALESRLEEMAPFKNICEELEAKLVAKCDELSVAENEVRQLKITVEEDNSRNMSIIDTLQNNLDSMTTQNELATSKINELNEVRASIEEQVCTNQERLSVRENELRTLNETLTILKNEKDTTNQRLTDEIKNRDEIISSQLSQLDDLKVDFEVMSSFKNRCEDVESQLSKERVQLAEAEIENSRLSTILQSEVATNSCIRKEIESLTVQNESAGREIEDNKKCLSAIKEQLCSAEQKLSSFEEEIGVLNVNLAQAIKEREKLSDEIGNRDLFISSQSSEIEALNAKIGVLSEYETQSLNNANELLRLEYEIGRLKTSLTNETDRYKVVKDENESLKSELESTKNIVGNYERISQQLLRVEEKLSKSENEVLRLQQELEERNKEFTDALENFNIQFLEKDDLLSVKDGVIQELQNNIEELSDVEQTKEQLAKLLSTKENYVSSLKKELSDALDNAQRQRDAIALENESLKEQLIGKETVSTKLNDELNLFKLENDVKCQILTEALSEKSREIETLSSEVEGLNRRLENTNMDLDIKTETILMMETTTNHLNQKVASLEFALNEKRQNCELIERDLESLRSAYFTFQDNCQREHIQSMEEMKRQLAKCDSQLSSLHKDNQSKCDQILKMAEELVQVSQTFNVEKTSLLDHAKNLEEFLARSAESEKQLKFELCALKKDVDLKLEIIAGFDEKISILTDKFETEKRELLSKNDFLKKEFESVSKNNEETIKRFQDSSTNYERFEKKATRLAKENEELNSKLVMKTDDIERYVKELDIMQKSLKNTISVNSELEKEIQAVTAARQQDISRLEAEKAVLNEKNTRLSAQISDVNGTLRQEYENKLQRLKEKLRITYSEKVEDLMKSETKEIRLLKEQLKDEKKRRTLAEEKIHEMSDQLLILQEENRTLMSSNVFRQPLPPMGPICNPAYETPPLNRSQSLDRFPALCQGLDNLGADVSLNSSTSSRRTSTSSSRSNNLPKGIGKVFPSAEEEGEVFDNRCLADLKAGICSLPPSNGDRMSILQQRNSMCPPHLKSSYPVETQFVDPHVAREDDFKTLTQPNWRLHQKENQPPSRTNQLPSRNNQPSSSSSSNSSSRKVSVTPSKLKALFTGRRKE